MPPLATSPGPAPTDRIRVVAATRHEHFEAVSRLQEEIWGSGAVAAPSTLVQVLGRAGGVVLLALAQGSPIGFVYGFVGRNHQGVLYHRSHAAGVLPQFRGRGVARRLKLAQRRAALAQGLDRMVWTFDPAQVGNAYFNLHRLGATARAFKADYYGQRPDALNHGLPTDRLVAEWFLAEGAQRQLAALRRAPQARLTVPAGLPQRDEDPPEVARGPQRRLRSGLEQSLALGLAAVDFDRPSRTYLWARLPMSFPEPAEPVD